MNAFNAAFKNNQAFIAYLTAGQRGLNYTEEAAHALVEGGVDILEIGVPFSDPVADGPTIQAAMQDALTHNVTLIDVLTVIKRIKQACKIPIVLFTYYNPLFKLGMAHALENAKAAGVDGILVVDLPLEESKPYYEQCSHHGILPIGLISPSTNVSRIQLMSQRTFGFLYYVARNDTTGVKHSLPNGFEKNIQRIKNVTTQPVVAGFGIGERTLAQRALNAADGFVVGSAIINAITAGAPPTELTTLACQIDPR